VKYKKGMRNKKHDKIDMRFREAERRVLLLFLLLYIVKIRKTASSSFERAATSRKRVLCRTFLYLIEKKIGTEQRLAILRMWIRHEYQIIRSSTHVTIGRSFRSLSLSLSKRCNEISMKNLAREYIIERARVLAKNCDTSSLIRAWKKAYDFAVYKTPHFTFRAY